jgi:quinol monooxygenase YgiN
MMIVSTMKISAYPEKRKELLQTITSLLTRTRSEKGCLSVRFYRDIEDFDTFIMVGEWESREDLDNHFRSDTFGVLLGALRVLSEPPDITLNVVSHRAGMEAVEAARR